jgi:hypothetical protein
MVPIPHYDAVFDIYNDCNLYLRQALGVIDQSFSDYFQSLGINQIPQLQQYSRLFFDPNLNITSMRLYNTMQAIDTYGDVILQRFPRSPYPTILPILPDLRPLSSLASDSSSESQAVLSSQSSMSVLTTDSPLGSFDYDFIEFLNELAI